MSFASPPLLSIIISPKGQELSSQKHNNLSDDYLRIITSQTGKYLASVSLKRQLTLFDVNDQTQFRGWTEQNVSYIAFSEKEDQFIAVSRAPSLKLFQINSSEASKLKSISLVKQIRPQLSTTTYGWAVWSLDNKWVIYVKNEDLFAVNMSTFEEFPLSVDNSVKSKCTPNFLLIDRPTKQLFSCSRNGQICSYAIDLSSKSPSVNILKSVKLSPSSITIGDFNQGKDFLMASSTAITQNKQIFYSTFVISKANLNLFWRSKLQQQLISPPLLVQADNIQNYMVTFLKGQSSLYIYSLQEMIASASNSSIQIISSDNLSTDNIKILNYRQKISVPYLLHSINYNEKSNKLSLGITGTNNQDKIIEASFMFNCSQIAKTSQQSTQPKQICTTECQSVNANSYFSFLEGKCVNKSIEVSNSQQNCIDKGRSYSWSQLGQTCELICGKVDNSVGGLSFGTPSQCLCQQNYLWSSKGSSCISIYVKQDSSKAQNTTSNSTIPIIPAIPTVPNSTTPIVPSIPTNPTIPSTPLNPTIQTNPTTPSKPNDQISPNNNTNPVPQTVTPISPAPTITPTTPQNNQNSSSSLVNSSNSLNPVAIVLPIITVLLVIGIVVFIYLYKKKKICFKPQSYVEDNELKESDIRSNQEFVNNQIDRKNTFPGNKDIQLSKQQQKVNPVEIQSPPKDFDFNKQINQPIDEFIIEEIISDSNDNQQPNDRADSQRKF